MGWEHDWFFTILSLTCSISAVLMQTGVCILSSFLLSSSTRLSVLLMTSSTFIKRYWFDKLLPLFLVGGLIHSLQYKGIMHSKCVLNGSHSPPKDLQCCWCQWVKLVFSSLLFKLLGCKRQKADLHSNRMTCLFCAPATTPRPLQSQTRGIDNTLSSSCSRHSSRSKYLMMLFVWQVDQSPDSQ